MAAGPANEVIPHFQEPKTTISPAIEKLLHEQVYVQDGIDYCEYKPIGPSNHFWENREKAKFRENERLAPSHSVSVIVINLFFSLNFLVDPLELQKAQRTAVFHFRDQNIFIDSRKIYCDITWSAFKAPSETALAQADMVINLFVNF